MENMNAGISEKDEDHIIRFDLKGSVINRFVKVNGSSNVVMQDNNYMFRMLGRPLPMRLSITRKLSKCVHNDTICLAKNNIIDYSLLTIIDTKKKKVRFGIIDYLQNYTFDRHLEY
mmetsp:Transcript_4753/g.3278  ORF Transcript_4753/g.3278 Transcript_4753/m.3278 type:complete len:116 (+) Transcript_4753:1365-1712(+)